MTLKNSLKLRNYIYIYIYGIILSIASFVLAILPGILSDFVLYTTYILRNLFLCITFPLLMCYVKRLPTEISRRFKICAITSSVIFAQFLSLGEFYSFDFSFNIFQSIQLSIIVWLLQSGTWILILYPIVKRVLWWFENYNIKKAKDKTNKLNYKRLFLITLAIRLVCFVLFYPCLFDYDAAFGLRTMLQPGEVISNHHPYFIQVIHKAFYVLGGNLCGRPDVGMAVLTIIWILTSSYIILYATKIFYLLVENIRVTNIFGYILALFPIFPLLSIYITKDGFFVYSFLLYTSCLLQIYVSQGKCLKNLLFLSMFLISMILMCFTRNQGIYIIAFESLYLLWVYRKFWGQLISVCIIPIFLFYWVTIFYYPSIHVESDSKKEAYNMFFQQTARYLKTYPKDVSANELSALKTVLNIDSIATSYKPSITDPVKKFYIYGRIPVAKQDSLQHFPRWNHQGESEALSNYRKAWLTMLLKHPDAYIDAQLAVIWPFFYNGNLSLIYLEAGWDKSTATNEEYSFFHSTKFIYMFYKVKTYLMLLPVTDMIFGVYAYLWISVFLILLLIWRLDWKGIGVFLPVIISQVLLSLCPVATTRYALPIVILIPLLFVYLLKTNPYNGTTKKNSSSNSLL